MLTVYCRSPMSATVQDPTKTIFRYPSQKFSEYPCRYRTGNTPSILVPKERPGYLPGLGMGWKSRFRLEA